MVVNRKLISGLVISALALGTLFGIAEYMPSKVNAEDTITQPYTRMGPGMGQYFRGDIHAFIAEKLDMTYDELFQARLDGDSIATLLAEKDIDAETIINELTATRKSELEQLVDDKIITEIQKDFMLERIKLQIKGTIYAEGIGPAYNRGDGCYYMNPGYPNRMGRGLRMGGGPIW